MATLSPRLLALDTSTDLLAVGLVTPEGRWTHHEAGSAAASARLLPVVQQLLARAGLRLDGLDAVAFGRGPGAFTGLRTACAVAQGLALGAGKPVLPIDSLLIVAEDARAALGDAGHDGDGRWWVAVDARMDEVYAAQWRWAAAVDPVAAAWQVVDAPALYTLPALAARWQAEPPGRVAGNACQVFADRLPCAQAVCRPTCDDRAGALLRLAEHAWRAGEAVDAARALPSYVRDKVALTTAERADLQHLRAAQSAP